MKKFYFLALSFFLVTAASAQNYCGSARYDTEIFSTVTATSNVQYGSAVNVNNQTQTLYMNIYEPQGDTAAIRPLIIFAHGGSFLGGNKTDADQVTLCTRFAKRGYVTATIDYRVGWGFPIDSVNGTKAVIRATQDMKAAVRFFRKDAYTTNTYKIDTNFIFVGGTSAGAFMALHLAYMNKLSEVPTWVNISAMGGLEGNSGNPGYLSTARGVVNLCGALGKASWIEPGDIGVVSMQGNSDNTVPYCHAIIYVLGYPIMTVDGAQPINVQCNAVGVTNPFYTWYNKDHCPFISSTAYMDSTVWFVSDFLYSQLGCTPSNPVVLPNTPASCTTGLDETASPQLPLSVYPNPSNGKYFVNVQLKGRTFGEVSDITGRTIAAFEITSPGFPFEIKSAPGIYFLKVKNEKGTGVSRLVLY